MNVPVMLSYPEFTKMGEVIDFIDHHGCEFVGWSEIINFGLGRDSEREYKEYTNWYTAKYTKLGKALE